MTDKSLRLRVSLFYSYSHEDTDHREAMRKTLSLLEQRGLLQGWDDTEILPGRRISAATRAKQKKAHISAFLLSSDFIASEECRKEWRFAKQLESEGKLLFRVPIIVRDCPWQDFLADDDIKALPRDGIAITDDRHQPDSAWMQVYDGIKAIVEELRATHTVKPQHRKFLDSTDIQTYTPISLSDLFVFPRLSERSFPNDQPNKPSESRIHTMTDLRQLGNSIVYGEDKSGKTALAKRLTQSLIDDQQPVLFVDVRNTTGPLGNRTLRRLYEEQFNGDYSLWLKQGEKTLVIDHMSEAPSLLPFITKYSEIFTTIYVFVSTAVFQSVLSDEYRLADFRQVRLGELTYRQQEQLIKSRLSNLSIPDSDGIVDEAERRVQSIITERKIVPRYPFFVLAVLQTYDRLMPHSLLITSYGHCYYVFIITSLVKAGISERDEDINSAFNFIEQLAVARFETHRNSESFNFADFRDTYTGEYFIRESILNRLIGDTRGVIARSGEFRQAYMYYYFLGKRFATDQRLSEQYLSDLCDNSFSEENFLTLLFAIHHATDNELINEILRRTSDELDDVEPAALIRNETATLARHLSDLPKDILSEKTVEQERAEQRRKMQEHEELQGGDPQDEEEPGEGVIKVLRTLRNNTILGQVLRNQYGKLSKTKIEDVIETIADSSFRLIRLTLSDEDDIRRLALNIHAKHPDEDYNTIKRILRYWTFVFTMNSIELAVEAVSIPDISEAVEKVVARKKTPAYDIFGYFYQIDAARQLTNTEVKKLDTLYSKHRDSFVKGVLSLRTQFYMNTHRIEPPVEQAIHETLHLQYRPRPHQPPIPSPPFTTPRSSKKRRRASDEK